MWKRKGSYSVLVVSTCGVFIQGLDLKRGEHDTMIFGSQLREKKLEDLQTYIPKDLD
jgi:hypothetical protein